MRRDFLLMFLVWFSALVLACLGLGFRPAPNPVLDPYLEKISRLLEEFHPTPGCPESTSSDWESGDDKDTGSYYECG